MDYNILCDLSWIANVYRYAMPELSYNGISTGMYYGTYHLIKKLKDENPQFIFHFCLDSHCKWRKELDSSYKSNRDSENKIFSQNFITLARLLKHLPDTHFYKVSNFEADDLISILSHKLKNVVIYTGDNDMLQLLPLGVKVAYKYQKGDFIYKTEDYVKQRFGLESKYLKYYRFLSGDKSDNIPKITSRLKEVELINFAKNWKDKSFKEALELCSAKMKQQILNNKDRLRLNIQLMDLFYKNSKIDDLEELKVTPDENIFNLLGIQVK